LASGATPQRTIRSTTSSAAAPHRELKQTIRTVSSTSSTILVAGESGTGKELAARVHLFAARRGESFVSSTAAHFPRRCSKVNFSVRQRRVYGRNQNSAGLFLTVPLSPATRMVLLVEETVRIVLLEFLDAALRR